MGKLPTIIKSVMVRNGRASVIALLCHYLGIEMYHSTERFGVGSILMLDHED